MKLKSFLKRLILIEEVIDRFQSPINGEILVYEDLFGKRSMRIGGVSQSGGLVVDIWKSALKAISNKPARLASPACRRLAMSGRQREAGRQLVIRDCLILGLGCGDAARIVSRKWPDAQIVGVEIDPKVIEVGKKYFDMSKISNLKIVIDDAFREIKYQISNIKNTGQKSKTKNEEKFNLILVDLYIGKNFPKEAEGEQFINGLKNILSENGIVVFNRFNWGEYKKEARNFEEKLRKHFPKVWTKKTVSNLLIFCQ